MVVVCEKCGTRFHLGDAKVPAQGARVRCSRCKHAFFIVPPGAGGEAVAEAAHASRGEVRQAAESSKDPAPAPERRASDVEEDWEFNDDPPPSGGTEPQPEPPEFDEFDVASMDLSGGASEPEAGSAAPDPDGDPEAPAAAEPALDPVAAIRARDAGLDFASPEDLGSPEEWDFVGSAEIEPPPEPAQEAVVPAVEETPEESPAPASLESPPLAPPPVEPDSVPLAARLGGLASVAGWLLVGLAFAMGLSGVLTRPDPGSAASREPSEISVPGVAVTATGLRERLVENALAGDLLVVSGELTNRASQPIQPGRAIQVQLVTAAGEPVEGATAAVGLRLSTERLREWDPDLLRRELALSAAALAQRSLRPGERLPFDAVFESVPESAAGWVLETATSPSDPSPWGSLPPAALPAWE